MGRGNNRFQVISTWNTSGAFVSKHCTIRESAVCNTNYFVIQIKKKVKTVETLDLK